MRGFCRLGLAVLLGLLVVRFLKLPYINDELYWTIGIDLRSLHPSLKAFVLMGIIVFFIRMLVDWLADKVWPIKEKKDGESVNNG